MKTTVGAEMTVVDPAHYMVNQQLGMISPVAGGDLAAGNVAITVSGSYLGRWYPVWRLPLHLVPPLAKLVATGNNMVCSELTARYLQEISARPGPYTGVNPDTLADEWRRWKNFSIVYEGEWPWET